MSEEILEFLKSDGAPVATTELFNGLSAEGKRSELYTELVKMERKGLIERSYGLEANGHTFGFTWTSL